MNFVEISIMGKKYRVPEELTVQKAIEYAGFRLIRGCGCRGGVCGACAMVFRTPESYQIKTGLACLTLVQDGMTLLILPYFPAEKAIYSIEEVEPTTETILDLYPEITKCIGCNACTKICPQEIQVMEVVSAALRGQIKKAAELSAKCVMCGLCAARCPGELTPHYIGLLCRRLYGRHMVPPYAHVLRRFKELDGGQYDKEMDRLMEIDTEEIRERYRINQADKRVI